VTVTVAGGTVTYTVGARSMVVLVVLVCVTVIALDGAMTLVLVAVVVSFPFQLPGVTTTAGAVTLNVIGLSLMSRHLTSIR
jgi:hypothetical protein